MVGASEQKGMLAADAGQYTTTGAIPKAISLGPRFCVSHS